MSMSNMAGDATPSPIEVAVFWDYENTPLPREVRPAEAAKSIQSAAESLPSVVRTGRTCQVRMRRVYYDPLKVRGVPRDPSGLDSSGFDLVSTPARNLKETVDKKLIVDLLTFAWEVRERGGQPLVVLITSDGDYSYALAKLNDRGVMNAVMYGRDESTAVILKEIAQDSLSFEKEVLLGGGTAAAAASALAPPQQHQHHQQHVSHLEDQSVPLPASNDWLQQKGAAAEPMQSESTAPSSTDRHVFLSQMPRGIEAREVYNLLTGTYGIDVRQVSMEILKKDATGRTRFAHVLCSARDADHLIALSKQSGLVYKDECISAIDDSKPLSAAQLRRLPSNLIYRSRDDDDDVGGGLSDEASSEGSGDKRRHFSSKKSSSILSLDDIGSNILAFCVCLSVKQKSWGSYKGMPEDECWVPNNIAASAFEPQDDEADPDIFRTVQDRAIASGFVETARHRLRDKDSYVPINLKEPTSNLSNVYYLRLTSFGRECVEEVMELEVESFCSALYRKQKSWSRGTGVPVDKCWIPMRVTEELYEPSFPLKDDKGINYQCRATRDVAMASDFLQMARKDMHSDKTEFIVREMWDSCEKGSLSDDLYFQLTAPGRRLAEQSLAPTKRPSEKRRKTSANTTADALSTGLRTRR